MESAVMTLSFVVPAAVVEVFVARPVVLFALLELAESDRFWVSGRVLPMEVELLQVVLVGAAVAIEIVEVRAFRCRNVRG